MRRIPLFAAGLSALMLTVAPAALAQAVQPLTVGQSIAGALTDGDAEGEDYLYDDYRLQLRAGQRIEATLRSEAFDAYLEIHADGATGEPVASDDDGLDDGTDARLRFTAPEAGVYILRARQFSGLEGGDYALSVSERAPAPLPGRPQSIRIGAEAEGSLDAAPEDDEGAPYRDFTVRLNRDQRVAVRLNSTDFDPMLRIGRLERGAFNQLAENDDGDDGLNSYLVFTAPTRGDYVIRATSFGGEGRGDFTLSLADGPPPAQVRNLTLGQSQEGSLGDASGSNEAGQRADPYRFTGREGQRVRLTLTSSDFDAYLELFHEAATGRESLATDDDGLGQGTDSRLIHVLPADGTYVVEARAFGGGGEGGYRLSLDDLPPPPEPVALSVGQTVQGEVVEEGAVDASGRAYAAYRFTATEGQRIQAIMRSGDFDAYLELGEVGKDFTALASDDDGLGEGTDARLNFIAPEAGEYEIRAMPLGGGGTGLFSLELIDRGPQPEPGSVLVGATVRGSISEHSALNDEGVYMDTYRLQAKSGEKLRLTMVSNDFDAFVEIGRGDDSFSRLAFDDDSLSDTHAQLDWSAPEDGAYIIRARGYGPNQTGAYALTVERKP